MSEEIKVPDTNVGVFNQAIARNAKDIRKHRAETVAEGTQLAYKRRVEDIEVKLRNLHRDQEAMLDLSPDNAMSLTVAKNFNPEQFVAKDEKIEMEIHRTEIKFNRMKARYEKLFGQYSSKF